MRHLLIFLFLCPPGGRALALATGPAGTRHVVILIGNMDGFRALRPDGRYIYQDHSLVEGIQFLKRNLTRRGLGVTVVERANAPELAAALGGRATAVIWIGHSWTQGGLIGADGVAGGAISRIPGTAFDGFKHAEDGPIFLPISCLTKSKVIEYYDLPAAKVRWFRDKSGEERKLNMNVFNVLKARFGTFLQLMNLADRGCEGALTGNPDNPVPETQPDVYSARDLD